MAIDWRLVILELLNFVVLMALLGRFLFRPVRDALIKRREEIEEQNRELATQQAEAVAVQEDYRARISGVREEGERLRTEIRREAEGRAERLVDTARQDMDESRRRHDADLELARLRSLESLRDQVVALAVQGATKVIAGMSETSIASAYAREGAQRLVEAGAIPHGTTLRVWTSPDADADSVQQALRDVLKDGCTLETEVDRDLVGGVRLGFRDLEVDASAGASLARWLADLEDAPPEEGGS